MRKVLVVVVSIVIATSGTAMALSSPGEGVLGSVHDMRYSAGAVDFGGNDRVCAFCHTPHHAYTDADPNAYYPLWSRQLNVETFSPYVSPTINSADYYLPDIAIGPTRLCMSCHDGSIAPDQHYNFAGMSNLLIGDSWGQPGIGAGENKLLDDHPIGFNYNEVAIGPAAGNPAGAIVFGREDYEDPWIREAATGVLNYGDRYQVRVVDRLFQGQYMTCATCHDVHNKLNADDPAAAMNYLVLAPQRDSALCLTCHIK
jgi:hypothetical protein